MKDWITKELAIYKELGMKPNFSKLGTFNGMDRRTVKKYFDCPFPKKKARVYKSLLDPYIDTIVETAKTEGVTYAGIYTLLKYEKGLKDLKYSTLTHFCRVHKVKLGTPGGVHLRFETPPGKQIQVDWKEDLQLTSRDGTQVFRFNVYSATLGCSRKHIFIYTPTKTEQDFMRCTREMLAELGGAPEIILTDNMSALVNVCGGKKTVHPSVLEWEKDSGIKISFCKTRHPYTKGKVESCNRFVNRLKAYNGNVGSVEDIKKAIKDIQNEANFNVNPETGMPPESLFQAKEKQALRPLPNLCLLMTYEDGGTTQKVPDTLLVPFQGRGYSVPPSYVGKTVRIAREGNTIAIYSSKQLIATHDFDEGKKINYRPQDYCDGLAAVLGDSFPDLDKLAKENLKRFEGGEK